MMNVLDNTDINTHTYYPVMGDMDHEPLISNTAHQAVPFTMRYLYFLSFSTGGCMAAGSQLLLSPLMQYTHPKNACQIWLAWTVWTCLVVFLGMTAWICLVLRGRSVQIDALSFKLQAHYIVGSLVSTCLILQITSVVKRSPPVALLVAVVATMVTWSSFVIWLILDSNHSYDGKDKDKDKGSIITSTLPLVGAKIGLITGFSQLVLCFLLYNRMYPAAGAVLSLLMWSGGAYALWTAAGTAGMHFIDRYECEDKVMDLVLLPKEATLEEGEAFV
jgi:hypothetical protein